jgi:hypothetical protein
MIILRETIYHPEGETKITEKDFTNKSQVVKLCKKYAPITSKHIYELTKYNEVFFEFGGLKRKLEIIEDNE